MWAIGKKISLNSLVFIALSTYFAIAQTPTSLLEGIMAEVESDIESARDYERKGDYNQAAFHLSKAGNAIWVYGDPNQAINLFQEAIQLNERIGNLNAIYVLSTNIGMIYTDVEDYRKALTFFGQATEKARQLNRKSNIASALTAQANASISLREYNQTISFLEEAESIAKELNDQRLLRNVYSLKSQAYDNMGNRGKASEFFDLFTALSRRIQQEELSAREQEASHMVTKAQSRVSQVEAEMRATEQELFRKELELLQKQRVLELAEQENQQRRMQIDLLNAERELQESIIKQQKLHRNIFLVIIFTVLIIASLVFFVNQKIKKANKLLSEKNEKISRQNSAIRKQAEQLRDLNQLKDKLFSIISHDLRSPLGSLITLLNLTKDGYFTEAGFKEVVNELSTNVGYTSALLENLLKWAQSQMQGTSVNPSTFNVSEVVDEVIPLYKEQLDRKGINVNNWVNRLHNAYADKDMIHLVIRNLLSNAIKFSCSGDTITLSSAQNNGMLEMCVADTGQGIPPEAKEKLFGKKIFSTRGTEDEKGTGLGLILCKDFTKLNGGDIWVESEEGQGTKFYFTLPLV